jgi:23S rRNA (pseudouridine1915-N3)-methyltransferase
MLLTLAHVGPPRSSKGGKSGPKSHYDTLTRLYVDRIASYQPCTAEAFPTESAFLARLGGKSTGPFLPVLLDSRGRQFSSTEFAAWLGTRRDQGTRHIVFAIGPPDGWSQAAHDAVRTQSGIALSFGPITLPHELARLVLAEQLYRACTILAGHPYHSGH